MDINKSLSLLYLDLLANYMKVITLCAAIPEARTLCALYSAIQGWKGDVDWKGAAVEARRYVLYNTWCYVMLEVYRVTC